MSCEVAISGTITHKCVVSRKEHWCCECRKVIRKGSKYWHFKGFWPSIRGWEVYKTCFSCGNVRRLALKKYPPEWDEDYPAFGELRYWIRESRR